MKLTLALLLMICVALVGAAESFDYHCANIALLQDKQVQAEVGITQAQRARMNQFADAHRKRLEAYQKQLAGKAPDVKVLTAYLEDLKKNVIGVLSGAQVKRVRELNLQAAGLIGLLDQVVAKRVGMSDSQYAKFKQTYLNGKNAAGEILRKAIKPIDQKYQKLASPYKGKEKEHEKELKALQDQYIAEAREAEKRVKPQIDAITRATEKNLRSQIAPTQQATWISLQGKKFVPKT